MGSRYCEAAFWSKTEGTELVCTDRGPEILNATPFPYALVCHQGHTEEIFSNELASHGITIDRPTRFIDHKKIENDDHPLVARLKDENTGVVHEVPTKYILGCDGGGSAVRRDMNIQSDIQQTPNSWAVADTVLSTNFPDVKRKVAIRTEKGSIMLIPYPHNSTRIYTLLSPDEVSTLERSKYHTKARSHENEETVTGILTKRAKNVLKPYEVEVKSVGWCSMYHIAQRVAQSFADPDDRVFILGDACHTHSPKAGQGMNVSMIDAYSLTWKLSLALRGLAKPGFMKSYEVERKHIAKQLIDFDHKFSTLFASPEAQQTSAFHNVYMEGKGFTSGIGHLYPPGVLVNEKVGVDIDQQALEPLTPGKRLYPIALSKNISGNPVNLLDEMPSNGKFHVFVFTGKNGLNSKDLATAANYLAGPGSPLDYMGHASDKSNNVLSDLAAEPHRIVDLYLIHTEDHLQVRMNELPAPFPEWQLRIYEDVFGKGHEQLGLKDQGALVVVRPDGYVGLVASLAEGSDVSKYFEGFLTVA